LRAYPYVASVQPFGDTLHYSDAREGLDAASVIRDVTAWLVARDIRELHITSIAPGIEDAFMALMGDAAGASA
jgi:hypothetical protein